MKKITSVLIILALVVGCGKKETTPTPTGPTVPADAPRFITHSIVVPAKLASSIDAHAQMVAYYMGLANALSASLSSYFLPPSLRKQRRVKATDRGSTLGVEARQRHRQDQSGRRQVPMGSLL